MIVRLRYDDIQIAFAFMNTQADERSAFCMI